MDELLLHICFFGGLAIVVLFAVIIAVKQHKRDLAKEKELKSENTEPDEPEYTATTVKATVVDQACWVKMVGIKMPKTVKEFVVVFQTEKGDTLKLNVSEEMYDGFEQGQTGMLSIVDGELYGFELQEDGDGMS